MRQKIHLPFSVIFCLSEKQRFKWISFGIQSNQSFVLASINILKTREKKKTTTQNKYWLITLSSWCWINYLLGLRNMYVEMLSFWGFSWIFILQIIRSFVLLVSGFSCCWGLGWRVREEREGGERFHAYKGAIEDQTKARLKTSSKKLWPRLKTQ